ncbi:MAG: acyl-CoA dehydratase activase-related protein [Firmicutes bacterium]|nr:acyl-CoA dehydratase activase-related protein [Bacillota bacterium]
METLRLGMDVGSTTVKVVVVDKDDNCLFKSYERHYSEIIKTGIDMLKSVMVMFPDYTFKMMFSGSGGMGLAEKLKMPFVQEVIALTEAIEKYIPQTDVAIELGGEDAKITYLGASSEQRMNGVCAGGTGAFIDQMAQLLQVEVNELNEMAKKYNTIYPIASRCGVFAKSDVQPLINEGANVSDIAVSIFQAVVNQTISGLACGRPIRGKVAFLGGPLTFMSELRNRFIDVLKLTDEDIIFPENSQYFVALGTAELVKKEEKEFKLSEVLSAIADRDISSENISTLPPLFKDEAEYNAFKERHAKAKVDRVDFDKSTPPYFLGIDAGSTTSKMAIIDNNGALVWSFYGSNEGKPLSNIVLQLLNLYKDIPKLKIARSGVTGYGEGLIKAALQVDEGEIETVAHFKAANFFKSGVDFILDIGGQDMKSLQVRDGVITSIMLNEACSSGCGSFIETYANSLSLPVKEFAQKALLSPSPVDLGTRCTVFMNSKIKQAQKDGASVGDISAGVSYSVIKNALYKVIKLKNTAELGENIVVQGGTFYNDAVLRAFELIIEREVIRPDIAGIMGAFGMALIAKERYSVEDKSILLGQKDLVKFNYVNDMKRCGLCGNNCLLTISTFPTGDFFVSGNRCERGAGIAEDAKNKLPNVYEYTYNRLFSYYHPLDKSLARRGTIGIPRALNVYAHYPLWFTFFTELGFRVELSNRSSKKIYESGMDSIPSESMCYPAKITNGHIMNLLKKGVKTIFYPSIPYDIKEEETAENQYNCPIVTSYPEVIENNIDDIRNDDITFIHPFLPIYDQKKMAIRLYDSLKKDFNISKKEIIFALEKAYDELGRYKRDIEEKGIDIVNKMHEKGMRGIVLAGRPYHVDPEIHHGIPEMFTQLGLVVLSEESIAKLAEDKDHLRVVNQWVYHSRLYNAAEFVKNEPTIELVQLTSFGCGLDAITTDQVKEILDRHGKLYTLIKIDEINNLGAARIRARSLLAAMNERTKNVDDFVKKPVLKTPTFKKGMEDYTLLAPQMSPIHFQFLKEAFRYHGYKLEVLEDISNKGMDLGLQYVNNDACYPTLVVIGQVLEALRSGKYDLKKIAILMTQTGGGCRATNYIALMTKALHDAGYPDIPIIPITASSNLEKSTGFKISMSFLHRVLMAIIYGDVLLRVYRATKPYEATEGSTEALYKKWVEKCDDSVYKGKFKQFSNYMKKIVEEFDELPRLDIKKPKVGIVGEILVKFHPFANNSVVDFLEKEGAEVVVPDLLDFFLYSLYSNIFKFEKLAGKKKEKTLAIWAINALEVYRRSARNALRKSKHFHEQATIGSLTEGAKPILSLGNSMGEGWFLTGEMVELIDSGVENIVCVQPFGCLPNHITGKGVIKELHHRYNDANIVAVDYDPGASEVNQINRLKLMLSKAYKNINNNAKNDK